MTTSMRSTAVTMFSLFLPPVPVAHFEQLFFADSGFVVAFVIFGVSHNLPVILVYAMKTEKITFCFFFSLWKGKGNETRCFIHYWPCAGEIEIKEISSNACTMFASCIWTTARSILLGWFDSTCSDFTGIWCRHRSDSVAHIRLAMRAHETSMRNLTFLCVRVCTMRCLCRTEGIQ